MLDKEYLRQWLINEKNYTGDGEIPEIAEDVIAKASQKYIEVYETITGKEFKPAESNPAERMKENLINSGFKV